MAGADAKPDGSSMDVEVLRRLAWQRNAVVSHDCAAELAGLRLLDEPSLPWLTVPRNRSSRPDGDVRVARCDLSESQRTEFEGIPATTPLQTVIDVARHMPHEQAVVVADSALHLGLVTRQHLVETAEALRGPGCGRVRKVVADADGRSQSVPESLLRLWLRSDPRVGRVIPQLQLFEGGHHYDFGLPDLRTVAEFQSWQWHGERRIWVQDTRWGNEAAARAWCYVQLVHEDRLRGPQHVCDTVLGLA